MTVIYLMFFSSISTDMFYFQLSTLSREELIGKGNDVVCAALISYT
jgi:hypothetical protein